MTKIHVLHHGFPLCDFTRDVPGDWPKDHQWLSKVEWKTIGAEMEDNPETEPCALCAAEMEKEG